MLHKPKKPSCFISYCHKSADLDSIGKFELLLREYLGKDSIILRDKNSSKAGDAVEEHENKIWAVDSVIILFTPEYLHKVKNRLDGAYREFAMIDTRHKEARENLKSGKSKVLDFRMIPILFSGTFKAVPHPQKGLIVPDNVMKDHESLFQEIAAQITQVSTEKHKDYLTLLSNVKRSLFINTKHEVLSKKFNSSELEHILNHIFVETRSYMDVRDDESVILTGRKGSGKSTTADHKVRYSSNHFDTVAKVNVDKWNFNLMHAMLLSPDYKSDIELLFETPRFFSVIWKAFFYLQFAKILVIEADAFSLEKKEILDNKILPMLNKIGDNKIAKDDLLKETTHEFTWVFRKAFVCISEIINETRNTEAEFGADLARDTSNYLFIERILGEVFLFSLSQVAEMEKSAYMVVDNFDMQFDDFRNSLTYRHSSKLEQIERNEFQISWLRGLFQAFIEIADSDNPIPSKIDLCIGVPKDRYFEIQQLERDGYRYSNVVRELRWSAIELMIMLRKRLEVYLNYESEDEDQRVKLNELLEKALSIKVDTISFSKNYNETDLFVYILRHTFWRPRDIITLVSKLVILASVLKKRGKELSPVDIKETISKCTYSIINDEFFREYSTACVNLKDIINAFSGCNNMLNFTELQKLIGANPFAFASANETLMSRKVRFLYEIGFLGLLIEPSESSERSWPHAFYFSHGEEILEEIIRLNRLEEITYIIHPIFSEYLRLKTRMGSYVNFYSQEFLDFTDI